MAAFKAHIEASRCCDAPVVALSVWQGVDVLACTFIFVPLMQRLIPSPRPPQSLIVGVYGFPSAHEVSTWALAWLVFQFWPRLAPVWFGLGVAIGWARLEAHAHYPYQVLAGAALGVGLGWWESRLSGGILLPRALGWIGGRRPKAPPGAAPDAGREKP